MKLSALCAALGAPAPEKDPEITEIVTDTKKIVPGALFVCITGTKFDSHACAGEMIAAGAAAVVTEREVPGDFCKIRVADTREAISVLSAAWYANPEKSFRHVIGITGTNGKTSTSMMLRRIFEADGHKVGLIGTTKYVVGDREYDAPMTTPGPQDLFRYFAEMREDGCDTLIMEVSSHSLSQKRVSPIPFTVGVFTNLTQDHLDYHGTMENYRKEKEKLFALCKTGVINADDPAACHFLESAKCPTVTYGISSGTYRAENVMLSASGVSYEAHTPEGGEVKIDLGIPGRFSVYNSLAALSAALVSGIPPKRVEEALCTMPGVDGRMQRLENTGSVSVIVDYAHTPDALENVLTTLKDIPHNKIYTVFGCGGDRDPKKRPLMGEIVCRLSDRAIVTSDNPRTEDPEKIIADILAGDLEREHLYAVITDRTEAIIRALTDARDGDIVLLAGKGHEEYIIDKTGKHPYSERAIVRTFYEKAREDKA